MVKYMNQLLRVTPDEIRKIIDWQLSVIEHIDACLRHKRAGSKEKLPNIVTEFNEDDLIAIAVGANTVLDKILFNQKCYNGYDTLSEQKVVKTSDRKLKVLRVFAGKGHPEYADWRRKYYTRDVTVD